MNLNHSAVLINLKCIYQAKTIINKLNIKMKNQNNMENYMSQAMIINLKINNK
jgi:hypothetical protein